MNFEKMLNSVPEEIEFHHLGYATKSIENDQRFMLQLGYKLDGNIFEDPHQGIRGAFFIGNGPCIELIENLPGTSTVTPWLDRGVKIYHIGYRVRNLDKCIQWVQSQRGIIVSEPKISVAFNPSRICFVMLRNQLLLEFIER